MKKKIRFRMLQRILILLLCTTLVSGTCFNKCKINARATSIAVGVGAYTLYEICLYVGTLLVTGVGIGFVVDNRDQIAQMGKDFIDSCDISELSGWMLSKVDTTGSSYVYGTEALQEVKDTAFEVIQGGGSSPKNDNDDDDGDKTPYELRTEELQNVGMWATTAFSAWICDQVESLINKLDAGEETFLDQYVEEYGYHGSQTPNAAGQYIPKGKIVSPNYNDSTGELFSISKQTICDGNLSDGPVAGYVNVTENINAYGHCSCGLSLYSYDGVVDSLSVYRTVYTYRLSDEKESEGSGSSNVLYSGHCLFSEIAFDFNFPIFKTYEAMENYLLTGDDSECINLSESYRIADWLQEDWRGCIESVNSGIRSIYDNMLIVGAAANQALQNQLNGLGYIEDLLARLAAALALPLPDTVSDPVYYPDTSEDPELEELPWEDVVPIPDPDPAPVPDPTPEPEPEPDEDLDIQNYVVDLRQVFPFCIPFDLMALFGALDADPVAPRFEIPFVVPSLDIEETYVIDLSFLDEQMVLLRKLELVGFIIGLMLLTGKVIKW